MVTTLPMDIIISEILPKLPAKSLIRFKSVCRYFQTLISSPQFVDLHLLHSLSSDSNRFIIFKAINGQFYSSFDLDSSEFRHLNLPLPQIFDSNFFDTCVAGSCNGLFCIVGFSDGIYAFFLLNPSTEIFRGNLYVRDSPLDRYVIWNFGFGFGFDNVGCDYKIVKLLEYHDGRFDDKRRQINVYSLKANRWRAINTITEDLIMDNNRTGALIDNHLVHWKFWNPSQKKHRIGCFDLRNEQWGNDVPLPDYFVGNKFADFLFDYYRMKQNDIVHLGVMDGCLCLLTVNQQPPLGIDVWSMKNYGMKESWVKLLRVSDFVTRSLQKSPTAYSRGSNWEFLLSKVCESELIWCAMETLKKDEINMKDKILKLRKDNPHYTQAYICKGSLVTIPGGRQIGTGKPPIQEN